MHWKFLRRGAVSPFTGFRWTAGTWVPAEPVAPCRSGIHACRLRDLPYWITEELWRIELAPPLVESRNKVVAGRARLLEPVTAWDSSTARALAEACVGRTAGHAAAELRAAGDHESADRLAAQPFGAVAATAESIAAALTERRTRRAAKLCGYVADAAAAVEGLPVACVAYIAARTADQRSGPPDADYYADERAWQSAWLADHLALDGAA